MWVLTAILLLMNGTWFALFLMRTSPVGGDVYPEVSLGEYRYENFGDHPGAIRSARFRLHVGLLEGWESAARHLLAMRKNRLEQDIEQLLREARDGDFDDPMLVELKRQIQETINQTLGKRVVSEVIITRLQIDRGRPLEAKPASSSPWGAVTAIDETP